jgi:murein DD-endopeptidase MepM/ murein hydrolase activator NlpD
VSNKGRLPWPVDNGYISEGFGVRSHATLKGVKTNNNGVNISVRKGSNARTIFAGTVKAIFSVPGMEKVVLINHGGAIQCMLICKM